MYKQGDVRLSRAIDAEHGSDAWYAEYDRILEETGYDREADGASITYDSRSRSDTSVSVAFLPHSCNQWVIGGEEEVRAMIVDLQGILEKIRKV